jgi:hypothetical protein
MIYVAYALRKTKRPPIIHEKTGEVIDDGTNKPIRLWGGENEAQIRHFADRVKENVSPRDWKIWVEKSS